MSDRLIISVSGLRGVVGVSLTPDVALRYTAAFAADLPPGPVVLARDGRSTGPVISLAVRAALCGSGRLVLDAGPAATPTLGVLVRSRLAAGGIQISASHNPAPYNGLKLFGADGRVLPAHLAELVRQRYEQGAAVWVGHDHLGATQILDDPHEAHLQAVLGTVDVARIRRQAFRVLLDSNHGAGGVLGRRLLEALGCQVVALGAEPTGRFAHPPEPTAANLASVTAQVITASAEVGFCQDPDADRLALIDEKGRYIGEEYTLALCLEHVLAQRCGPVVTNCATSRMCEDIAAAHGAPFYRSAVGEANVVDLMLQHEAVFGGEGNGGPIDPRVVLVRDSFTGMAQVLDLLAHRQQPLSRIADALPRYQIHKTTVKIQPEKIPAALQALEHFFRPPQTSRQDGLRMDWNDRWLLIRASNTEPIVRAIAEAPTLEQAQQLCQQAAQVISG